MMLRHAAILLIRCHVVMTLPTALITRHAAADTLALRQLHTRRYAR